MRILLHFVIGLLALPAQTHAAEVVPTPPFRSIDLRGGGDVTIVRGPVQRVTILSGSSAFTRIYGEKEGQLRIDACNSRCPRNYPLQIRIESPTVPAVALEGGGMIVAAPGFAPQGDIAVAVDGGGEIDLRAVPVSNARAAVNGGGEIKLQSRNLLTAAVSGGGAVHYWGNPRVMTAINGGGTVERVR